MPLRRRVRSFGHALRGVAHVVRAETNMRIHLAAAVAVVALGLWLELDAADWRWLVLAIALVPAAEAMNTALESLADAAVPERDERVRVAKDAAAGAVLLTAVGAAVLGLLVLGPPLLARLGWA